MIIQKFNPATGFLETIYSGKVSLTDILKYNSRIRKNRRYPRKLKILSDATAVQFVLTKEDLKIISERVKQMLNDYDAVYDAMILNKPKETAYSMLYKGMAKIKNYHFQYFSTKEAALEWLNSF